MYCPKCQSDNHETPRTIKDEDGQVRRLHTCKQCRTQFVGVAENDVRVERTYDLFDAPARPMSDKAVVCPLCGSSHTRVVSTRRGDTDIRVHECKACNGRWRSIEKIVSVYLYNPYTMHSELIPLKKYLAKMERERAEF